MEQAVARARRLRSHADLKLEDRTVDVYHLVLRKSPQDESLRAPVDKNDDMPSADVLLRMTAKAKNDELENVVMPALVGPDWRTK